MKKQRLLEIQEKATAGNAELADCIEILSEFFISQSQNNKEIKNELTSLNNKLDSLNRKLDHLIKFTSTYPIAQILIENMEETEQDED
jgi:hypothetical protein